ncbi:MAG: carboxypeptidase-like regulatory domain-containing protein [Bacteroidales bacterium]|nr:carboxypeptidase-like regulatory domain-containing protein [Bacteroidales bacterium]
MKRIILFLNLLLFWQMASAQILTVTGQVTSAEDTYPLPGVSVVVKGTMNGTFTDADGFYNIEVQSGQTLLFSSIGFTDYEQKISRGGGI